MAERKSYFLTLSLSLLLCVCRYGWCADPSASPPAGHMQPLGSHMEPKPVLSINHMLTPQEFQEKYVKPKKPVIFEGLMRNTDVIKNWQSDDYLRTHFGNDLMAIEPKKKENRSLHGLDISMAEFLDKYNNSDIYMVSDPSPGMYDEWQLPRFLLCGGFTDHLAIILLWFSSGGTKSVVHTDNIENLHCLISGTKKFVMIKPQFAPFIGPEHKDKGFYDIDVESVNMTTYPNLAKIPWHLAVLQPGDCLYLPYLWIHHVNSEGRNMGLNIWWNMFDFNADSCPSDASELPEFAPLSNYELESVVEFKKMLNAAKADDGNVYAEDLLTPMLVAQGIKLDDMYELLEDMKSGCDGILSNIDELPRDSLRKGAMFLQDLFSSQAHSEEEDEDPLSDDSLEEEEHQQRDEL